MAGLMAITEQGQITIPHSPTPPLSRPGTPDLKSSLLTSALHISLPSAFGLSDLDTPPSSPPTTSHCNQPHSLLYPPTNQPRLSADEEIYAIGAGDLATAMRHAASQPLPDPSLVFPWLHGLHAQNHSQLSYFNARSPQSQRTPECIRGLLLVKVGGDPSCSRIKGAVLVEEILEPGHMSGAAGFRDVDPRHAICPRNFQIQAVKMATVSDIVIYGDDSAEESSRVDIARNVRVAQVITRLKLCQQLGHDNLADFNTFVLTEPFSSFEALNPDLVALDGNGRPNPCVTDLIHLERVEMSAMSKATEIAPHVWLGCTADLRNHLRRDADSDLPSFTLNIECIDDAVLPSRLRLKRIATACKRSTGPHRVEFPASMAYALNKEVTAEDLIVMCRWIEALVNQRAGTSQTIYDSAYPEGASTEALAPPEILIHCQDGYTETTLLAVSFYMYANGATLEEAYKNMHTVKGRNFYNHPQDLEALKIIEYQILSQTPHRSQSIIEQPTMRSAWFEQMQGSLPSRVLPYMYLGNLPHANNQGMLRSLGISRIVSVGEAISWSRRERALWGEQNILHVQAIQDNGSDSLTDKILHCLDFIEEGKMRGMKTLVHCRVGVSRSATICIAEVMKTMSLSFPQA